MPSKRTILIGYDDRPMSSASKGPLMKLLVNAMPLAAVCLVLGLAMPAIAQDFSFDEFVGTWEGTISSENFGGYSDPITLVVQPDGFYTDSSGHLMPTIYPETQQCAFDAPTNRVHFWWLQTVYSGQYFYTHVYHEVVAYTGNYLELHYNFWDDDTPHPQAQTIVLYRAGVTAVDAAPAAATSLLAYPNPFNPATSVAFELAASGPARLDIMDLRGRRVTTLLDGDLAAGRHQRTWRGVDDGGRPVAGGVYLARLTTATGQQLIKLSLAK